MPAIAVARHPGAYGASEYAQGTFDCSGLIRFSMTRKWRPQFQAFRTGARELRECSQRCASAKASAAACSLLAA